MQVRNVTHHVRSKEGIRLAVSGDDLPCQIFIEEWAYRIDAFFAGDPGDVGGRLDSEMPDLRVGKMFHQDAVVAADFHHERIALLEMISHHVPGEFSEMCGH